MRKPRHEPDPYSGRVAVAEDEPDDDNHKDPPPPQDPPEGPGGD